MDGLWVGWLWMDGFVGDGLWIGWWMGGFVGDGLWVGWLWIMDELVMGDGLGVWKVDF